MPRHERPKKGRGAGTEYRRQETEVEPPAADRTASEEINEGIDDLLDEIDEVLEENAQEFVQNYVQKGGE